MRGSDEAYCGFYIRCGCVVPHGLSACSRVRLLSTPNERRHHSVGWVHGVSNINELKTRKEFRPPPACRLQGAATFQQVGGVNKEWKDICRACWFTRSLRPPDMMRNDNPPQPPSEVTVNGIVRRFSERMNVERPDDLLVTSLAAQEAHDEEAKRRAESLNYRWQRLFIDEFASFNQ
jgi:hypothetical protein